MLNKIELISQNLEVSVEDAGVWALITLVRNATWSKAYIEAAERVENAAKKKVGETVWSDVCHCKLQEQMILHVSGYSMDKSCEKMFPYTAQTSP